MSRFLLRLLPCDAFESSDFPFFHWFRAELKPPLRLLETTLPPLEAKDD